MTWPDLPPPNTLMPFEAVVRHGSVSAAAQELHVTHGAVSRQVRNLERALGVVLFERSARSLRPTPQARELAAVVRDALDRIDTAARRIARREDADSGPLTLSCEPTLLMRWLIPRLPGLAVHAPGVTVHLSAGGGPVSFAPDRHDGVDVAIRRNDFPFPEQVSRAPLFTERTGPVCRPDLAARLTDPSRLATTTLLHTRTRPRAWDDWFRAAGLAADAAAGAGHQHLEHFSLTLQAAESGLGVAIGPYALVRDDIERGRLAAPYGFVPDGSSYHLLSRRPPERDERVRLLLDWLRAQAADVLPKSYEEGPGSATGV
ncbi:LysR substrate-binding domain-containing protein [Streptomyces purpureus]|uniref:LysR family transcriptional regulator n=1 Tax=Streptomyces purpureus TaxID=1951 RepID=A0A918GWZ5_9ACTN|nr:LysR substrate-binding domain-containing protein [Streptomyces purpureus]GGT17047.1 LysR family transcriptional regulator [Streptomyces purpureus]